MFEKKDKTKKKYIKEILKLNEMNLKFFWSPQLLQNAIRKKQSNQKHINVPGNSYITLSLIRLDRDRNIY